MQFFPPVVECEYFAMRLMRTLACLRACVRAWLLLDVIVQAEMSCSSGVMKGRCARDTCRRHIG
eukprot:COSAG02_NODE_49867_length_324_cov_0.688889_1_plen_63_part_10